MTSPPVAYPAGTLFGTVKYVGGRSISSGPELDASQNFEPYSGYVQITSAPATVSLPGSTELTVGPYVFDLDPAGVMRDPQLRDEISLVSNDTPGMVPTGWTYEAQFFLDNGVIVEPKHFRLPAGQTVDLASWVSVDESLGVVLARGPAGQPGPPGPVGLTGSTATTQWQPNTAYTAGQFVINPAGQIVKAKAAFNSGASYAAANWTVLDPMEYRDEDTGKADGTQPTAADTGQTLTITGIAATASVRLGGVWELPTTAPVSPTGTTAVYLGTSARAVDLPPSEMGATFQFRDDGAGADGAGGCTIIVLPTGTKNIVDDANTTINTTMHLNIRRDNANLTGCLNQNGFTDLLALQSYGVVYFDPPLELNRQYKVAFEVDGDRAYVYLPQGRSMVVKNPRIAVSGSRVIWELTRPTATSEVPGFVSRWCSWERRTAPRTVRAAGFADLAEGLNRAKTGTTVFKKVDESVTNTNVFQLDDHLLFSAAATSEYVVSGTLFYDSSTAADLKWTLGGPAGATLRLATVGAPLAAAAVPFIPEQRHVFLPAGGNTFNGGVGVGTIISLDFRCHVITSTATGNISLSWTQLAADVTATTVRQGSFLRYEKVV